MSNIDASADSVEELEPLVARIRQRGPEVKIVLRGDGGFRREKLMAMRFQLLRHWSRQRRVIAKAEHIAKGPNPPAQELKAH